MNFPILREIHFSFLKAESKISLKKWKGILVSKIQLKLPQVLTILFLLSKGKTFEDIYSVQ